MKIHIREIAWVVVAQAAAFIGGLAMVKTSAVVLGPSEYGKLSVSLAVVGIAQVCLYGSIAQTATRFFSFSVHHDLHRRYELCLAGMNAAAVLFIGVGCIVGVVAGVAGYLPLAFAYLAVYAVISGTQMVMVAIFSAARKRKVVAAVQLSEAIARPVALLLMASSVTPNAYHALAAYVFSASAIVLLAVAMYWKSDWSSIAAGSDEMQCATGVAGNKLTSDMVNFALPFFVFGLLGVIGTHGERLLLAAWVDWSEVGSYALMAQLVMAPNVLFTTVVNQFYFPLVFQHDPGGTRDISRSFRLYLLISVLGVMAITATAAVFGPTLISMFSSKAFLGHEHLLWYLGISAGVFCMAQQLVLPGLRLNRPQIYMPAKLFHSAALFGSAVLLVPKWGIDGMGISSMGSSLVYLTVVLLANNWLRKRIAFRKSAAKSDEYAG